MFNLNILKEKFKRLNYNKALVAIPTAILTFSVNELFGIFNYNRTIR